MQSTKNLFGKNDLLALTIGGILAISSQSALAQEQDRNNVTTTSAMLEEVTVDRAQEGGALAAGADCDHRVQRRPDRSAGRFVTCRTFR